jgi:sporulation protein YlmC with PRC-barrel domain
MQFKPSSMVYTLDGENVGRVDRIVLDPRTKDITHLLVRSKFLLTEDKVVPVGLIVAATEKGVTLWGDLDDFEALPLFEETHYLRAAGNLPSPATHDALLLGWYPPAGGVPPRAAVSPSTLDVIEFKQNIPEGTVALRERAKVIANDGKQVGTVEQVLMDPHLDQATNLVIAQGLLMKERRRVPIQWVSEVREGEIHLAVGADTLEELGFIP